MHDNVNISKELQETKQMFDNVLLAQGRLKSGTRTGSSHTDERLSEISFNILNKVRTLDLKNQSNSIIRQEVKMR